MVGGFLGAGKTTLLYETTKLLMHSGKSVGLITNDQAPELVDTAWLLHADFKVAELSGSCFCCNYDGFIDSVNKVRLEARADFILAEPVGSCTDLSATIMQPLKEQYNQELKIAPLTVLADPVKLANILEGGTARLHPSASYIYRKQLEESDIILITKSDWFAPGQLQDFMEKVQLYYPQQQVLSVSAKTGAGIGEWLHLLEKSTGSGQRIVEVDYNRYAEGEAVLGWLNATVLLRGNNIDWDVFSKDFLARLGQKIKDMDAAVGHIKIMLDATADYIIGNLTGTIETLNLRGSAGTGNEARLIINARVELAPEVLDQVVRETLIEITLDSIAVQVKAWQCLSPGYPKPSHRYTSIV
jgi:Ni2+-binding GTPase involved in maturation of urease and hydrogenase